MICSLWQRCVSQHWTAPPKLTFLAEQDALVIRCVIKSGPTTVYPLVPPFCALNYAYAPTSALFEQFNNDTSADCCFSFRGDDGTVERRIYVNKSVLLALGDGYFKSCTSSRPLCRCKELIAAPVLDSGFTESQLVELEALPESTSSSS